MDEFFDIVGGDALSSDMYVLIQHYKDAHVAVHGVRSQVFFETAERSYERDAEGKPIVVRRAIFAWKDQMQGLGADDMKKAIMALREGANEHDAVETGLRSAAVDTRRLERIAALREEANAIATATRRGRA